MQTTEIPIAQRVRVSSFEVSEERLATIEMAKSLRREMRYRQRWQIATAISSMSAIALLFY